MSDRHLIWFGEGAIAALLYVASVCLARLLVFRQPRVWHWEAWSMSWQWPLFLLLLPVLLWMERRDARRRAERTWIDLGP